MKVVASAFLISLTNCALVVLLVISGELFNQHGTQRFFKREGSVSCPLCAMPHKLGTHSELRLPTLTCGVRFSIYSDF